MRAARKNHKERLYEEVVKNIKDVIALCLEDLKTKRKAVPKQPEIIGFQRVEVSW